MPLGSGSTVPVTQANLDSFLALSGEFGNVNLYISLMEHFDSDFIRSRIDDLTTLDIVSEHLIGRISSKFYGPKRSELEAIPVFVLSAILLDNLLMISSENVIFSFRRLLFNFQICYSRLLTRTSYGFPRLVRFAIVQMFGHADADMHLHGQLPAVIVTHITKFVNCRG
jgi:hypothetical protein